MPKMREKINNRKLKAIGYLDLILTLNIICLVFFMVIGKFYPPHKNVNQEETTTEELEQVEKTRWGNLGFYSSTSFLVMVGIYALSSSCMLAQASNLQKMERKKQYLMVEYWVDNAFEVLIIMTMAWFSLMVKALRNEDCNAVFTNAAIQVPYLLFYKVKIVHLVLVWQEHKKFTDEDKGLKDKNWVTWQTLLRFQVGPKEDIETGAFEQELVGRQGVGGRQCMTGGRGRRNRLRARRNHARINRLRSNVN